MNLSVEKIEWRKNTQLFLRVSKKQLQISQKKKNCYDAKRNTRLNCDACHNGLGAIVEQQTDEGDLAQFFLHLDTQISTKKSTDEIRTNRGCLGS